MLARHEDAGEPVVGVQDGLLGDALANLPEAVLLIRAGDGVIQHANDCCNRLFGYDDGELVGRHISLLTVPGEDEVPGALVHSIVEGLAGDGVWHGETHGLRRDGSRFSCDSSIGQFDSATQGRIWVMVATRPRPEPF